MSPPSLNLPPLSKGAFEMYVSVPRHAVGPRGVARAGEVWRAFQEAAVQASAAVGWDHDRYVSEKSAFVVYALVARHHRPLRYGQRLRARTWVRDFRRGVLSRRQVVLFDDAGVLAESTQHWVHVGANQKPARASAALVDAFAVVEHDRPTVELEAVEALPHRDAAWRFEVWHSWMDPLDHANHPLYIDWCDEAVARVASQAGLDPHGIQPIEERIDWKRAAVAGDMVVVRSTLVGQCRARDAAVIEHRLEAPNGDLFATAVTTRTMMDGGAAPLVGAFG